MHRIAFEVDFVTPAFVGGARREDAEWRAESIRGQLHWWYRAVAGAHFVRQNQTAGRALQQMRDEEQRIFGSTQRRSSIAVLSLATPKVQTAAKPPAVCRWGKPLNEAETAQRWGSPIPLPRLSLPFSANPIHYLGYGPIDRGKISRGFIPAGEKASFAVQFGDEAPSPLFWDALFAWLTLGGIGARSRHGFGSLAVRSVSPAVEGHTFDQSEKGVREWLDRRLTTAPSNAAEWSHFTSASRVYISRTPAPSWEEALTFAGGWLMAFRRRYGAPGDERTAKRNRDYAWAAPKGTARRQGFPDRAGFGLPLSFGEGGEHVIWGEGGHDNRRASPLLLRVSRFNGKFHSVWTHLPARFLPDGEELAFKNAAPAPGVSTTPGPAMTGIVAEFLNDLESKNLIQVLR